MDKGNHNSTTRHLCFFWCTSIFLIDFSYDLKNFYSLIGFLRVNWNGMFTLLVFWISQASTFFIYGKLVIVAIITFNLQSDFFNSATSHTCFLRKKTWEKQSLFCYTRKHSTVWISNVFWRDWQNFGMFKLLQGTIFAKLLRVG